MPMQHHNPYLFIVGAPRSGTTLLKRMVDAHPQISVTPETHWIPRYFRKCIELSHQGSVTPELVRKLWKHHKIPKLEIDREEFDKLIATGEPVSYSNFVSGIFDLYGQRNGKRLVGDKTPGYVRSIPLLHSLWPKARFVHLIRDGRDVCLSLFNWRKTQQIANHYASWKEDSVSTAALWWKWQVGLGLEAGRTLPRGLYYELRYEALIHDPPNQCATLCEFLGVPYDDAMLRFHEGRTKTRLGLSAKKAWLPPTSGLRDWRSQFPAEDVERFEAAAGDLLEALGYPLGASNLSSEAKARAVKMGDQFEGRPLPERW